MVTVNLTATMPETELERFLRIIRSWDAGREEIKASIQIQAHDMEVAEVDQIIRNLEPALPVVVKFDTPESVGEKARSAKELSDAFQNLMSRPRES